MPHFASKKQHEHVADTKSQCLGMASLIFGAGEHQLAAWRATNACSNVAIPFYIVETIEIVVTCCDMSRDML